jgi:signal transduction histidine kinase
MSHELRTPLNAIIGFSELLGEETFGPLTPKQQEYVTNVQQSGRHLLTLVNDILDLSSIEADRMTLARAWTSPVEVIDTVLAIVRPLISQQGVVLECAPPPELPSVHADPVRLKQILYNLLSNAIKFTPRGGQVRLTAAADGESLTIAVLDTGIGIRAEELPRLFQEFERIEPASGPMPAGTGLGLAISRRFAELHGGTLTAESQPGRGSTFTLRLPLRGSGS